MSHSPFNTLSRFNPPAQPEALFYSLPALAAADIGNIARLPVSLRIVLESLLRHCDGHRVTSGISSSWPQWQPRAPRSEEIPFVVARVVLQDFTGVPLLCDLAAMRHVAQASGHDPRASSRWCRSIWSSTIRCRLTITARRRRWSRTCAGSSSATTSAISS
jgi:aconitate hydratase